MIKWNKILPLDSNIFIAIYNTTHSWETNIFDYYV